jgi:hypothetical protein
MIIDDIITYLETGKGALERIFSYKNGLVFDAEKFYFARKEVDFAGFMITEDGIKPASKCTAIINM